MYRLAKTMKKKFFELRWPETWIGELATGVILGLLVIWVEFAG